MFGQAVGYERFMGRWSRMLARQFVEFALLSGAGRVLDVGCGTGALAQAILDASPQAHVVGIDPSRALVEHARSLMRERARFDVGDAQRLPFDDGSFDAACACLVFNFIPDQRAALAELCRVVRPGGTVATAVWDHAEGMLMLKTFWDAADAVDPGERLLEEPQPMLDRDGLIGLWREQGLADCTTASLVFEMRFSSFDDYWQPFGLAQGPAGAYLAAVSPAVRAGIEQELRRRLLVRGRDEPFALSARAWAIRGSTT